MGAPGCLQGACGERPGSVRGASGERPGSVRGSVRGTVRGAGASGERPRIVREALGSVRVASGERPEIVRGASGHPGNAIQYALAYIFSICCETKVGNIILKTVSVQVNWLASN